MVQKKPNFFFVAKFFLNNSLLTVYLFFASCINNIFLLEKLLSVHRITIYWQWIHHKNVKKVLPSKNKLQDKGLGSASTLMRRSLLWAYPLKAESDAKIANDRGRGVSGEKVANETQKSNWGSWANRYNKSSNEWQMRQENHDLAKPNARRRSQKNDDFNSTLMRKQPRKREASIHPHGLLPFGPVPPSVRLE